MCLALPLGAANAHDELVASSPTPDEVFTESPTEIQLRFSDTVQEIGAEVQVQSLADKGESFTEKLALNLNADTVTASLSEPLPDGAYRVVWRVVSADGHPIADAIPFAVGADGDQALQDAHAQAATQNGDGAAANATGQNPDGTSDSPEANTGRVLMGSVIALAGAAILIGVFVWFRKSQKDAGQ